MRPFRPSNLLEAIAQQIAAAKGNESAAMVRKEIRYAAEILRIVAEDLKLYLIHDEEGAVEHLTEAAEGRDYSNPIG